MGGGHAMSKWNDAETTKPEVNRNVLVYDPTWDDHDIHYWDGSQWYDDQSFPVRVGAKYWAELPKPPKKKKKTKR
jgi:hypothetical protein